MAKTKNTVKQVIVMRTDTDPPMRKGKMIAQGCHASIAFLTRRIEDVRCNKGFNEFNDYGDFSITKGLDLTAAQIEWMFNGAFAKICVRTDSLEEFHAVANKARQAGLEVHIVTDSGKTEFKEPTVTCMAIGPDYSDKLDPITGHLNLL
jgi:PTH2 family peptidyl-tRNA hydrolase